MLFNTISTDKKTMLDKNISGIFNFAREDDYDFYDLVVDIIDGTTDYLEYELLEEFNYGDMVDIERLCKRFFK